MATNAQLTEEYLQIIKALDGDVEGVALIRPHGDEPAAHSEAVQVARHRAVHIRQFLGVEVVARREVERPVLGGLDISRETQVLRKSPFILQGDLSRT